jgi:hypothetical protein
MGWYACLQITALELLIPLADTRETFAKKDLPHKHQIIEPGSFTTMDHDKDRMKVHLGDDGTVRYCLMADSRLDVANGVIEM